MRLVLLALLLVVLVVCNDGLDGADGIKGSLSNWDLFRRPGPWISDPPAPCNVDMVERVIDSTMYLIFFVTGSGSTILCTLLRAQNIPCLDEPSLDKEMFNGKAFRSKRQLFVNHTLLPPELTESPIVGAKVKLERPSQVPRKVLELLLSKKPTQFPLRVVVLHRRDIVRHTVGLIRKRHLPPVVVPSAAGNRTVVLHAGGLGNAYAGRLTPPIDIKQAEYVNYLFHVVNANKALQVPGGASAAATSPNPLQDFEAALTELHYPVLRLIYEDHLVYPWLWNDTASCLVKFLRGRDAKALPVHLDPSWPVKNTKDLSADVLNFEQLREFTLELQSLIHLQPILDWPKDKLKERSAFTHELW